MFLVELSGGCDQLVGSMSSSRKIFREISIERFGEFTEILSSLKIG